MEIPELIKRKKISNAMFHKFQIVRFNVQYLCPDCAEKNNYEAEFVLHVTQNAKYRSKSFFFCSLEDLDKPNY